MRKKNRRIRFRGSPAKWGGGNLCGYTRLGGREGGLPPLYVRGKGNGHTYMDMLVRIYLQSQMLIILFNRRKIYCLFSMRRDLSSPCMTDSKGGRESPPGPLFSLPLFLLGAMCAAVGWGKKEKRERQSLRELSQYVPPPFPLSSFVPVTPTTRPISRSPRRRRRGRKSEKERIDWQSRRQPCRQKGNVVPSVMNITVSKTNTVLALCICRSPFPRFWFGQFHTRLFSAMQPHMGKGGGGWGIPPCMWSNLM